ncbi:ATP-binding protein [Promicromonospora sp. NPDC090134]|uniref:ATP-binding protein n=1 Tax=Promicromonospora sp. NPDC090134 TaxID=3364408 RepID=UPI0037F99AA4
METRRVLGRLNRGRRSPLVAVGLAGFVVAVYVLVVLGGGAIIGRTDSPSPPLAVLATAVVALLIAPVQAALERAATSVGHGGAAAPYDVLSRFSEAATVGSATEQLPARMSTLLAQGTGAQWAQVWLTVSGRLTLAATWPANADDDRITPSLRPGGVDATGRGRRALAVRHGGQFLGVLRLQERPGLALTAVEERLFAGLAAQAGLVLRLVGLRAELEDRHAELTARADQLQASRERLIEAQDAERRRLERDIHDGAQQHLVALTVNLRLAQTIAVRSPERAARVLAGQADAARAAIETLSSLSRGIYPRLLSDEGLVPALRSAVATSAIPVTVDADGLGRIPTPVEAALYFCCMEAVQNATKHSGARSVAVHLGEEQHRWHLTVTDDGTGFDQGPAGAVGTGAGLANMRDRLDAVGGTVTIGSRSGSGTTVIAVVPRAVPGQAHTLIPSQVG